MPTSFYKKFVYIICLLIVLPLKSAWAFNLPSHEEVLNAHPEIVLEEIIKDLPQSASLDNPALQLVNRDNPLEEEMWIDFVYSNEGLPFNYMAYESYYSLMSAGLEAGFSYSNVSAYRSMNEQAINRENRIQSYLNEGLSYDEALYWTNAYYAPVDASEHLTGLALDLLGYDWTSIGGGLHGDYGYQASAIWLADHAHEHGFILRYPEGRTDVTGYNYEPWHFRYVGQDHAQFIYDHNLVLEEYLALIAYRDSL